VERRLFWLDSLSSRQLMNVCFCFCLSGEQRARFNAMYDERLRQYRAGERKSEDYYGPVPQKDSY